MESLAGGNTVLTKHSEQLVVIIWHCEVPLFGCAAHGLNVSRDVSRLSGDDVPAGKAEARLNEASDTSAGRLSCGKFPGVGVVDLSPGLEPGK